MDKRTAALVAVAGVVAAGAIGARFSPADSRTGLWYATLNKPDFTPPGPAIGAAWGVLELLMAGAGYRLLRARRSGARSTALAGWAGTLAGLAGYPFLFFGQKRLAASTGASAAMLASAVTTAIAARAADRSAAAMTLPLLAWLSFATFLSEEVWRRN